MKSKKNLYLLWCLGLIGLPGAHRIYMGYYKTGVILISPLPLMLFGFYSSDTFSGLVAASQIIQLIDLFRFNAFTKGETLYDLKKMGDKLVQPFSELKTLKKDLEPLKPYLKVKGRSKEKIKSTPITPELMPRIVFEDSSKTLIGVKKVWNGWQIRYTVQGQSGSRLTTISRNTSGSTIGFKVYWN